MACKSGLYAINTYVGASISDGGTYAPATLVRKYGNSVALGSNGIVLNDIGYYDVTVIPTVTATAVGSITATLYKGDVAVPGATTTVTASAIGDEVALPIDAIVRARCCVDAGTELTVKISGQATTSYNLSWTVERE